MTYSNYNKLFNDIADEQEVEVGSKAWEDGGIRAYSGTTGGHAAYGWRHDHLLSSEWVRAVVANYGHRRIYYDNGDVINRRVGYEDGGRPWDYQPELPGDQPNGNALYLSSKGIVKVTGPDPLHYHIGPLLALYDSQGWQIKALGKLWPAKLVAGVIAKYFLKELAGWSKDSKGGVYSYAFGDRGSANIVHAAAHGIKRNLFFPNDLTAVSEYVEQTTLPYFEKEVGVSLNTKPSTINNLPNHQLYNGLYWLIPSFYDAWAVSPNGAIKDRIWAILRRWCQWMEDMEKVQPDATRAWAVTLPDPIIQSSTPLETWNGIIQQENIVIGSSDWSRWGLRAQLVAAHVLNSAILKDAGERSKAKWLAHSSGKEWLVNYDNTYL